MSKRKQSKQSQGPSIQHLPPGQSIELGPDSAGQSGDTQGLSNLADADSESVEELLTEGQTFEAEAVSGVEDAPEAGVAEVHTRQFPEDDVPLEYQESDS